MGYSTDGGVPSYGIFNGAASPTTAQMGNTLGDREMIKHEFVKVHHTAETTTLERPRDLEFSLAVRIEQLQGVMMVLSTHNCGNEQAVQSTIDLASELADDVAALWTALPVPLTLKQ